MGIDVQQFRASIGNFTAKNIPYKSCKEKLEKKIKRRKQNLFQILLKLILFIALAFELTEQTSAIHIAANDQHSLSSNPGGKSLNVIRIFVKVETDDGSHYYKFSNINNKYVKYVNGNRKQGGIKIYHWNKGNTHL